MWKKEAESASIAPLAEVHATDGEAPVPGRTVALDTTIGKLVVIQGELSGGEDLTIDGQFDGTISLEKNVLTVGAQGRVRAEVRAKVVVVEGRVTGNVTAMEKIDIRGNGVIEGDLAAPIITIAEGAHFRGSVDMPMDAAGEQTAAALKARPTAARSRRPTQSETAAAPKTAAPGA